MAKNHADRQETLPVAAEALNHDTAQHPAVPVVSDEQLVEPALAGVGEAFAELYRRHKRAAYIEARKVLDNDADAEDAVQAGFIKAYERLSSFKRQSGFKTWLLAIVHRAAVDIGRGNSRRRAITEEAQ